VSGDLRPEAGAKCVPVEPFKDRIFGQIELIN
jgi:hypothetical protein